MDKWGRKFGFVKFLGVREVETLCEKLQEVWWENYKLKVNKARFRKGDKKEKASSDDNQSPRLLLGNDFKVSEEVSFKSRLLGEEGSKGDQVSFGVAKRRDEGRRKRYRAETMGDIVPLELPVLEMTLRNLKQRMVGFFKDSMDFNSFQDRLILEGQLEVKVTKMGGNMVLLQCPNEGELKEVMKFNKQWWDHCFAKIVPWKPNMVSECREIWIDVYGIPFHAWEEGTFKMVAGRFGVFLDFDAATVSKQRLDVARVKLRTVMRGMIDTVV
jgi:hypothetical protein